MTARVSASLPLIPLVPTLPAHATSKDYVDQKVADVVAGSVTIGDITGLQGALDGKIDKSLLDAKGDLIVATGDNTPGRLGVGADGQVLLSDSTQTVGVKWAPAPVSGATQTDVNNSITAERTAVATLTNKTLTAPVLSGTVTGTYTLGGTPTFPATVVLTTATQTLTAKTLTSPTINTANLSSPKFTNLGFIADNSSNELLVFGSVASAINEFRITNAIAGVSPQFQATGTDTNVGIDFLTKGTGIARVNSQAIVVTSDSRLSDARTPTAHVHTIANVTGLQAALDAKLNATNNASGQIVRSALLNTHMENTGPVVLPHMFNDNHYLTVRAGGSVSAFTINGAAQPGYDWYNAFVPDLSYTSFPIAATTDIAIIELTLARPIQYSFTVGIVMTEWTRAQDVKIETYDTVQGWVQLTSVTGDLTGYVWVPTGNNNQVTKVRYTLTNFPSVTPCRITSMFQTAFNSELLTSGFVPRGGGSFYGDLVVPQVYTNYPATVSSATRKDYVDTGDAAREPTIAAGTTSQFWRGDKTWQAIPIPTRASLLIDQVDNVSDVNKPVSTAQQTALNLKANDNAVVKLTGVQTVAGAKSFTSPIDLGANKITSLLDPTVAQDAATKAYVDSKSGAASTFTANVGNGALTSIPITHNLGTRNVNVAVYDSVTYEQVKPDIFRTSTNVVTLVFATAPATNAYIAVITGGGLVTTVASTDITDSTPTGRSLLASGTVAAARAAIGAGVPDLAGAYSALPAAGIAGRSYQATDIGATLLDNGASWDRTSIDSVGGGLIVTPPTTGWTTTTLGTATVGADRDGRLVTCPTIAGDNLRGEYRNLVSAINYTFTIYLDVTTSDTANYMTSGLWLRSAAGNFISFGPSFNSQANLACYTWSSQTAYAGNYKSVTIYALPNGMPKWLRCRDDGTNRIMEWSYNGIDWVLFHSVVRTDYFTPTAIGWGITNNATAAPTAFARLRSWTVV